MSYVLAVSWQPSFCELNRAKPECESQTPDRVDARQFSLHGLWPEPRGNFYCGVSEEHIAADKQGDWDKLPTLNLPSGLRARLDAAMPGSQSYLDRHEWIKHGTCHEDPTPEAYFRDSLKLLDELNASPVKKLFEESIGVDLAYIDVIQIVDIAFGDGAGFRIQLLCKKKDEQNLIVEMRIGLAGTVAGQSLEDMIQRSVSMPTECRSGRVDAAGFND
ncbi:ribonuclease T2 family protein [Pacificispira spongiicola]|nr:ribonuclease T [Pacificispira spongiicola]